MNDTEQKALLTLCIMAAFADGRQDDREREQIRSICESLAPGSALDLPALLQGVLLKRISLEAAASGLTTPEARNLAYEMAVCVCDADGGRGLEEAAFLERLRAALALDPARAAAFSQASAEIATAPLAAATPPAVDLEKQVLNSSILTAALEMLPQSLATMAVIPLQLKMVYGIGKAHGFELDRGHIRDFAGALGLGMAGQILGGVGRKLLGGLLGSLGGSIGRGLGRTAASAATTFATTYAMGQTAIRYYAGGRKLSAADLKAVYAGLLDQGKALFTRHSAEVESRAGSLDSAKIAELVRGS